MLAAGATYTLTTPIPGTDFGPNGLPIVSGALIIEGNGATIERSSAGGTPAFRLLQVGAGSSVELRGLTLRGGASGSIEGGGIFNAGGTVTLTNSTVSGNAAGATRRRHLQRRRHGDADRQHRQRQRVRVRRRRRHLRRSGGTVTLTPAPSAATRPPPLAAASVTVGGTVTLTASTVSGNTAGCRRRRHPG